MKTKNSQSAPRIILGKPPEWPPGAHDMFPDPYVPSDPKETVRPLIEQYQKDLDRIFREHKAKQAGAGEADSD